MAIGYKKNGDPKKPTSDELVSTYVLAMTNEDESISPLLWYIMDTIGLMKEIYSEEMMNHWGSETETAVMVRKQLKMIGVAVPATGGDDDEDL